mgnify:CR=1 FL=1
MDRIDIKRIVTEAYDKSKDLSAQGKDIAAEKIKDKIRDIAYKNAIERCKQEKVNPDDLSADEMGVIVNEEEKKIKGKIKDMTTSGILAFLGLESILG